MMQLERIATGEEAKETANTILKSQNLQPGPGPGPEQNIEGHGGFLLFSRWSIPNSLTQSPLLVLHMHHRSLPQLTLTLPS